VRVTCLTLWPLHLPFVEQFAHAAKTRRASDTLIFKVETNTGFWGYGETLVRPYVTGESLADLTGWLPGLCTALGRIDFKPLDTATGLRDLATALDQLLQPVDKARPPQVIALGGLRCGLELAILDALLHEAGRSLMELLPPVRRELSYSAVVSAADAEKTLKVLRHFKQLGFKQFKLKVAGQSDVALVEQARQTLGAAASLRLDANCAFTPESARVFAEAVQHLNIAALEQPLPRGDVEVLAKLQAAISLPILHDESLISLADGQALVRCAPPGMFNIRLAKCGGLWASLQLAQLAQEAGWPVQLGCLVGETAILSAVGRVLAAHLPQCSFVEGSFGTLLLQQDISRQSVRFGFAGRAGLLPGPGFGIEVDESVVRKYALADGVRGWPCST
jgi:L-alanine-DL-glutamate epimerase-like enolase superfamily enzyme